MIVLGIDPGFARTGYGVVEEKNKNLRMLDYGCISTPAGVVFEKRLEKIREELTRLIKKYKPGVCAVEKIFFCKNTKTAIDVGQARGVVILTAAEKNLKILEFTPLQVKQSITGYGKAEKQQMQKMVKILLGLKDIPRPDDAADALALAIAGSNNFLTK
ncbi:crossover junction endodeoxyribonuclease RuvC [Candidatus Falkowbacteria bacterium]|nr:crossover junction endodeoxyribonuclease RuvC [Candidatus Falkowbacteria bacterium]